MLLKHCMSWLQQYVEELRNCLQMEAAHQPLTPAALRVVKLANEIVRTRFRSPAFPSPDPHLHVSLVIVHGSM